jgi:transposase
VSGNAGCRWRKAGRDLDVHENELRKWVKEFGSEPVHASRPGTLKPEQQKSSVFVREVTS